MKLSRTTLFGIVIGLVIGLAIGMYLAFPPDNVQAVSVPSASPAKEIPPLSKSDISIMESMSRVFNHVSQKVNNTVVHITATKVIQRQRRNMMPFNDEFFRRFFPEEQFPHSFSSPEQPEKRMALGSGVIIDPNGYIVTNNHVVKDADKIQIVFSDGRKYDPEWVRTDKHTDLALIKINIKNLHYLKFANSENVNVGDWVFAVGNPFGLDNTVTQGIVSYVGRGLTLANYSSYIQTDAAINPGNSGGPLVNYKGEIIGINTAIVSRTASFAGIGFAIPSNTVKFVVGQLKKSDKVVRSYLGVTIQDLSAGVADSFKLKSTHGSLVSGVKPGSPASKGGIKIEDVLLKYNGVTVKNSDHLKDLVAQTKPGSTVPVEVWRDNKKVELKIKLQQMPDKYFEHKPDWFSGQSTPESSQEFELKDLGVTVMTLNKELAQKYGHDGLKGAVITNVKPLSEASSVGLSEGDLIMKVQDKKITSAKDVAQTLSKFPLKEGVRFFVRSPGGGQRFIFIKTK